MGKLDSFNPTHDYNTDAKKIRKKAGYNWGGRIPDMVDLDRPSAHTHILFMNEGKVAAYLPYNVLSTPVIIRLHNWSEGDFENRDNLAFRIDINDGDSGGSSFVLTP